MSFLPLGLEVITLSPYFFLNLNSRRYRCTLSRNVLISSPAPYHIYLRLPMPTTQPHNHSGEGEIFPLLCHLDVQDLTYGDQKTLKALY